MPYVGGDQMELIKRRAMYRKKEFGIGAGNFSIQFSDTKPVYVKETAYVKDRRVVKRRAHRRRKPQRKRRSI